MVNKAVEAFTNHNSEIFNTQESQLRTAEESNSAYAGHGGKSYGYGSFQDIDHTNKTVPQEYAHGSGWKVWVKIGGNPPLRQAKPKAPFPVPEYHHADGFDVPDAGWTDFKKRREHDQVSEQQPFSCSVG
jgi:hypothetical protein